MIENIELQELTPQEREGKPLLSKRDMSLCDHVTAEAEVMVCSLNITIEELFALKVGSIVKSDESIETPMRLFVNGKPIARGNLVAIDDKFGFEVTEINE